MFTGLSPLGQQSVLEPFVTDWQRRDLPGLLEKVHERFGCEALGLGYAGVRGGVGRQMKRELLSPRATTHWDELVRVKA